MGEVLEKFPGAKSALFRKYHVGGCSSCGYEPTDTLEKVIQSYPVTGGMESAPEFGKPTEEPGKLPGHEHSAGGVLGGTQNVSIDRSKIAFSGECELVLSGTGVDDIDALVEKLKDVDGIEATASAEKNAIHIRVTKGAADYGRTPGKTDEFGKEPGKTDEFGEEPGKTDEFGEEPGKTDELDKLPGRTDEFDELPSRLGGGADVMKDENLVQLSTILDAIGAKACREDVEPGKSGMEPGESGMEPEHTHEENFGEEKEFGEEEKAGGAAATGDLYLENIIWGARRID